MVPVELIAWDQVKTFTKTVARTMAKRDPTVTSPQLQSAHATIAFLSIICGTTAVPPRLQHIRRGRCRGRRFRHPSIGRSFHPDFVRTTSQSGTCCIAFHLLNEILGKASSRFAQQLPQFHHIAPR